MSLTTLTPATDRREALEVIRGLLSATGALGGALWSDARIMALRDVVASLVRGQAREVAGHRVYALAEAGPFREAGLVALLEWIGWDPDSENGRAVAWYDRRTEAEG